jgi:serine O-acetyltransferase
MIQSRSDYLAYLKADRAALRVSDSTLRSRFHVLWQFQKLLRRVEFLTNCPRKPWTLPWFLWTKWRFKQASIRLGFSISPNSIGKGLQIGHYGDIVINGKARLGDGCAIAGAGVLVGEDLTNPEAPIIGNRCYLGPGCKVIGPVKIADGVTIAANAVVVHDITEPNITVGGIPARKISSATVMPDSL